MLEKNDNSLVRPFDNTRNTLSYIDGDIVDLNAVWKENSYSLGMDVNGGYGNDTIIVTGYEKIIAFHMNLQDQDII